MADNKSNQQEVLLSERLKQLRKDILALENQETELTESQTEELNKQYTILSKLEKLQEKRIKKAQGTALEELKIKQTFSQQNSELSSLSSMYKKLADSQKTNLKYAENSIAINQKDLLKTEGSKEILDSTIAGVSTLQGLQQKLATSGSENPEQQEAIRQAYAAQELSLQQNIASKLAVRQISEGEANALNEMITSQRRSMGIAEQYATQTEMAKQTIEKQIQVYKGIQKTIVGVIGTAKELASTVGGVIGSLLIGMGAVATAVGETTREFGGFVGGLTGATGQTTLLKLAFKDASAVTKELANQFGGVEGSTFRTRLNTNLMAVNMGISGESAARLVGTLARTGGMTAQQAMDLAESTKQFAKQQGVIPSQAMEDIAQNSELFASYGASATEELAKSAVQAAKLGVSMSTLGKVTDGLLDFESSITKELELSAMLGRNINLNRARGLAFEGKTGAAVKETIKQLGGAAAFEKMNVIQRRQAAEALGLSVDELDKMAKNMDKLNDDGSMQLSTFDTWSQSLTAFATGPMGKTLKGLGGIAIAAGQATPFLKDMGINLGGAVKSTGQILKNMVGLVAQGAKWVASKVFGSGTMSAASGMMGKAGDFLKNSKVGQGASKLKDRLLQGVTSPKVDTPIKTPKINTPPKIDPKSGDGPSKLSKSIGKIKMNDVLKGAAALVIIAGAMWVLGKALQEFKGIGLDTLGIAGLAILGLTLSLVAVGLLMNVAGPYILLGAAAMLVIAASMWVLGKALQEIQKVGDMDLLSLGKNIAGLGFALLPLGLVSPLLALAGMALGIMGAGLGLFGAGLSMIPLDTLVGLKDMVVGLVPMIGGIVSLAGAFTLLAASLGLLSIAGIAALPTLIALSAIGIGLGAIAGLFGGGSSSESEEKDEESISEYQMMVLTGLTEVRDAINNKNMNVYLDGQLLTDFVRANSDGGGNQGATLLTAKK